MRTEKVAFTGSAGHRLSGLLDLPDDEPRAFVLFAHCFTCGKSLAAVRHVSRQLTTEGFALLRFDFTGLGQSEGEFADTTFTTNLTDLVQAARFLEAEFTAPRVLVGHSLGGAAVLAAAANIPSTRCVAVIGAPSDPTHLKHLLNGEPADGGDALDVSIGGRPFRIGRELIDDLGKQDLPARIAELGKPLLIFHSPTDAIVGIENAERIYKAAKHPKSFISLGRADHLVSQPQDAAFLGHVLSAWSAYYAGD